MEKGKSTKLLTNGDQGTVNGRWRFEHCPSTRLNRTYSGLLEIMGVLLLLTSLVLTLCPLQISRGHGFGFWHRVAKPVSFPNTEQSHYTASLGTKLFFHFILSPNQAAFVIITLDQKRLDMNKRKDTKKKKPNSKLPFPYYHIAALESENKNLHR